MSVDAGVFVDTNVLLYLRSGEPAKADRAEAILRLRPIVSVQVLNEFANVSRRKLRRDWREIEDALARIKAICPVTPLTVEVHERGIELAAIHGLAIYDAMIVAAARQAGCATLLSEDLQHGRRFGRLAVVNPLA
jgi:predicted nucleic acid-binding protein